MADTAATPTTPDVVTKDLVAKDGEHTIKFEIKMTCGGCSGAVDRVLKKLDGVREHEVDLKGQTAIVIGAPELEYDTVLEKISKTGKQVNKGWFDGEEKSVVVATAA